MNISIKELEEKIIKKFRLDKDIKLVFGNLTIYILDKEVYIIQDENTKNESLII